MDQQHDPPVLARMAHGRMRRKIPQLQEALTGQFTPHHAFLCQMMLDRIDDLTARIDRLTAPIDDQIAPYAPRWSNWMRSQASDRSRPRN
jgi:transposase